MRNPHKVRYPHTFRNEMTTLAQNAVSFFSKYTDESPLIKACRNSGRGNANYAIILMHLKCCFWLPPPGNEERRVLRLVWAVCALLRGRHLSMFFKCPIWFHSHDKLLWSQCPYAPSFYNKTPRHREVTQWRGRTGDPELSTRLQISARETPHSTVTSTTEDSGVQGSSPYPVTKMMAAGTRPQTNSQKVRF